MLEFHSVEFASNLTLLISHYAITDQEEEGCSRSLPFLQTNFVNNCVEQLTKTVSSTNQFELNRSINMSSLNSNPKRMHEPPLRKNLKVCIKKSRPPVV